MLTPDWQDAFHNAMGARLDHGADLTGGCESQLSTSRCADRTLKGRLAMAREAAAHARAFGVRVPAVPTRAADLEVFAGWLLLAIKLAAEAVGVDAYSDRRLADIAAEKQAYAEKSRTNWDSGLTMDELHAYALTDCCPDCGVGHENTEESPCCYSCLGNRLPIGRAARCFLGLLLGNDLSENLFVQPGLDCQEAAIDRALEAPTKYEVARESNRRVAAMLADSSSHAPTPWTIAKAAEQALDRASEAAMEQAKGGPWEPCASIIDAAHMNALAALKLVLWHREHGSLE